MSIQSSLIWHATHQATQLSAPLVHAWQSEFRSDLGWNDIARHRFQLYRLNMLSTARPLTGLQHEAENESTRLNIGQIIEMYNKSPMADLDEQTNREHAIVARMMSTARYQGVRVATGNIAYNQPGSDPHGAEWRRLIDMSATAAPLGHTIRDYYRSRFLPDAEKTVTRDELNYHLQRHQYRRFEDRKILLKPFYNWSPIDALRAVQAGVINADTYDSILYAAGMAQNQDWEMFKELADPMEPSRIVTLYMRGVIDLDETHKQLSLAGVVQEQHREYMISMMYVPPSDHQLLHAATRRAWDNALAAKWGLDDGLEESPAVRFWMEAEGHSKPAAGLPGADAEGGDWLKVQWRAGRTLPDFHTATHMQYRLRPNGQGAGESVIPGYAEWKPEDTVEMLKLHGYSQRLANQISGLTQEPINLRLLQTMLAGVLDHQDVKALAEKVFGPDVDWVYESLRDHGQTDPHSQLLALAFKKEAERLHYAERLALQKRDRADVREMAIDEYLQGTMTFRDARGEMVDSQVTGPMAAGMLVNAKRKQDYQTVQKKIKVVEEAFMGGYLTRYLAEGALYGVGMLAEPVKELIDTWEYLQTTHKRQLTTAEILTAMKDGILPPDVAITRLANLGWDNTDAMIEVAMLQHEIRNAQAKQQQTAQAKAAAEQQRKLHETQRTIKEQNAAKLKAQAEAMRHNKVLLLATHKKLMAESAYFAKVHRANAAFAEAQKTDNTEKMEAELSSEVAYYQQWLLDQLELATQGKDVERAIGGIDTRQAAGPKEIEGVSEDTPGPDTQADNIGGDIGGTTPAKPTPQTV